MTKYSFTCPSCKEPVSTHDWCIIRDKVTDHLRQCKPASIRITCEEGIAGTLARGMTVTEFRWSDKFEKAAKKQKDGGIIFREWVEEK